MKINPTLEKLVSLLGHSENDPEVIAVLTELGVKLPLKKPSRSEDGYLIELKNPKFYLGVKLQEVLPVIPNRDKLKEKELIFCEIAHVKKQKTLEAIIFPFGISYGMPLDEVKQILGEYFDEREFLDGTKKYFWYKDNTIILLCFDNQDFVCEIGYRLIYDFDLEKLDIKI